MDVFLFHYLPVPLSNKALMTLNQTFCHVLTYKTKQHIRCSCWIPLNGGLLVNYAIVENWKLWCTFDTIMEAVWPKMFSGQKEDWRGTMRGNIPGGVPWKTITDWNLQLNAPVETTVTYMNVIKYVITMTMPMIHSLCFRHAYGSLHSIKYIYTIYNVTYSHGASKATQKL